MTLVKRLLDWKALGVHPDICREAAAEIERLEATTDTSIKDQVIARHVDNFTKQEAEIERLLTRMMELERDNEHLRAEIEVLQRMRHREAVT